MSSAITDEEGIAELQRKDWDFAAVTASATGSTLLIRSSVLLQEMAPIAVALRMPAFIAFKKCSSTISQ
ncbi:hypothetical protein [Sinorhizobium sp. 6-117]|uniref:hypothetical protein n=1 Tax=Sinorhizobium sp. 6-117 TaxID=3049090 RepID=UPI0024C4707E|nr:hypothetical protein [Sinorhizobium sp. 6-117]